MSHQIDDLPSPTRLDRAHTLARIGLSAIPIVGGPAVEILNAALAPPLVARRDKWLQELAEAIVDLQERIESVSIASLAADDAFVSAAMQAASAAMREHHREKLDALRNAVLNTALRRSADATLEEHFLHLVQQLTVSHLRLLSLYSDVSAPYYTRRMLQSEFPIPVLGEEFGASLARDLVSAGLLEDPEPQFPLSGFSSDGGPVSEPQSRPAAGWTVARQNPFEEESPNEVLLAGRVTDMGRQFLAFVNSPKLSGEGGSSSGPSDR